MRKPVKSKQDIVNDFITVFRKNGLNGATLSRLVKASGLQRASLYHYFPNGKKDMYISVLQKVIDDLNIKVLSVLKENKDPRLRLNNMLKAVDQFYAGGSELCFITVFSFGEGSDVVQKSLSSAIHTWTLQIERALREMQAPFAKKTAHLIMSSIQGSLTLSHINKNPSFFKNSLKVIKRFIV